MRGPFWSFMLSVFVPTVACTFWPVETSRAVGSEPYCGVYSLHACGKMLGVDAEFEELLQNQYVVGWNGSTLESIAQAASDLRLAAMPLERMGTWDLRLASNPLILHVRSDSTRPFFDHWVVYLGEADGQSRLLDPSHGEVTLPYADLLAIWDGAGLAVSNHRSDLWGWRLMGYSLRLVAFIAVGFGGVSLFRLLQSMCPHRQHGVVASVRQATAGLLVLGIFGLLLDLACGASVMANPRSSRTIETLYQPRQFPKVATNEVIKVIRSEHGREQFTLIDARRPEAFQYRHLPDAVSIPVNCSPNAESEAVRDINRGQRLIIYCQSEGCGYSDVVAKRLYARGFRNIQIYDEGVDGWEHAHRDKEVREGRHTLER